MMYRILFRVTLFTAIFGLLIGACATTSSETDATQPPSSAESPIPAVGETAEPQVSTSTESPAPAYDESMRCVRIAQSDAAGEQNSLDPIRMLTSQPGQILFSMYNGLLTLDSSFQPHPELAVSWESNEDKTEWTFHLREGVQFHNGKPFTAKDVVWTYQRLIDPDAGSESFNVLSFLTPESIVAVDDYTVKFVLDNPVPELPVMITTKNALIVPEGMTEETLRLNGVGTGPFIPVDFEPLQVPNRLVKNPNYWEPGLPKADCIEYYLITEPVARAAAIEANEIDIVTYVSPDTLPGLMNNSDIILSETSAANMLAFAAWVDTPPFDDIRVLQALKMLMDREEMVELALSGYGEVGDDNPVPPSWPQAWRHEVPEQDIEGAKNLLDEAGYGPDNPLKLDLYTGDVEPGALAIAQIFQQQAAEAGVEVNLMLGPPEEHWDNVWNMFPFYGTAWVIKPMTEMLPLIFHSEAYYNENHWYRPDFDELIDTAVITLDDDERLDLYQKALKMLSEEGGQITPVFNHTLSAVRSNCEGWKPHVQLYRIDVRNLFCTP